jgi:DGQHR domain-containing protein
MVTTSAPLKRRALRLAQAAGHDVFMLSLSPTDLLAIGNASPDQTQSLADLLGADQPTVEKHIATIQSGLDADDALLLTTVVIALSPEVRFRSSRGPDVSDGLATSGTIEIPSRTRAGRKPAQILDGFHRLLALSNRKHKDFAIPVCAVVADDPDVLRQYFDRIHCTHPLPTGFADLLLPQRAVAISPRIGAQALPDAVCQWLNNDPKSPLHQLIGPAEPEKAASRFPVSRAALRETIAHSLSSPYGALFPYRNIAGGETDVDGLCNALKTYWAAVKSVFPEAWGKPPKKSRLMHPAGIRIMGRLMNRVLPAVDLAADDRIHQAARQLEKIKPLCRWTSGVWEALDGLAWDKLENTTRHVDLVSNFLIRAYLTG